MISVVMTIYNTESYLPGCLDSLLNQTYKDFEALLIDDGSTDRTGAICDEYAAKDHRLRVFHTENGGVASARNVALNYIQGDYMAFLDSDDWMEPDMLEKLASMVDGSGWDVAMCNAYNVDAHKRYPSSLCRGLPEFAQGNEVLRAFLGHSGTMWNKLIGMKCVGETRFRKEERYCEDIVFLWEIAERVQSLKITQEALYNYRWARPGNVTTAALNPGYSDFIAFTERASDKLISLGFCFEAVSRIRMCVGRVLRASAQAPLAASVQHRMRCSALLKKGSKYAHLIVKDREVHGKSKYIRYFQYQACRISPTLVVLLFKMKNAVLRLVH